MPSVSRNGEATEPVSRWSRPITTGADTSPLRTSVVEDQSGLGAVALAEPADPGRQPLELDPIGRELEPPLQQRVVGEGLPQRLVDTMDIGGIARQRRPPKRPGAAAEQRPHVGGHEPGKSNACSSPASSASVRRLLP